MLNLRIDTTTTLESPVTNTIADLVKTAAAQIRAGKTEGIIRHNGQEVGAFYLELPDDSKE